MGAQAPSWSLPSQNCNAPALGHTSSHIAMAPMKAMKTAKTMTKGAIADSLATSCELKKSVCAKMINSLAELATAEVAKAGVFTLPGLCRLKTRTKPATKAGKREVFGKVVMVKARPARKIVKAFPVSALKKSMHN